MNVLAINFNHDGSAVILKDGRIAGYVNTERFSRKKKHPGVREEELEELLRQAGLTIEQVDLAICVNLNTMDSEDIVDLHGSNLKETWPDFWIDRAFERIRVMGNTIPCSIPKQHHVFHAATSYYFSPFDSCVTFSCDPLGAEAYFVRDGRYIPAEDPQRYLVSPSVYSLISHRLFGSSLTGAGKLMALAPYGRDTPSIDYDALLKLKPMQAYEALLTAIGVDPNSKVLKLNDAELSLAFHAQTLLEVELLQVLTQLRERSSLLGIEPNLCMSGGTALNSVANQRCFEPAGFRRLYLHPACGDDGTAIGAALIHWHNTMRQPKVRRSNREAMYSCKTYDGELWDALYPFREQVLVREGRDYLVEAVKMIASGKVVGWFQGASEIGPRALGNRSILADPRSEVIRDFINRKIKERETFRPFAPAVLAEMSEEWFGISDSPFMLRVASVLSDKVPGITHVDKSARVQTVAYEDNPSFHQLIEQFFHVTGIPMLLNTSFNGKGEPIVETPADAIRCMLQTGLDAAVFPNLIVSRRS